MFETVQADHWAENLSFLEVEGKENYIDGQQNIYWMVLLKHQYNKEKSLLLDKSKTQHLKQPENLFLTCI